VLRILPTVGFATTSGSNGIPRTKKRTGTLKSSRRQEKSEIRIERSPLEIKREMKMIGHIEGAVQAVRVLVGVVVFFCLLSAVAWLRSDFCGDRRENALASIPQWASLLLVVAFTFGSIFLAFAVSDLRFWKRYLDVLRRKRMQSFWAWRSATLRFPAGHTIYSGDFERSEPPEPSEDRNKSPYSFD
jgi:hypothetical protein